MQKSQSKLRQKLYRVPSGQDWTPTACGYNWTVFRTVFNIFRLLNVYIWYLSCTLPSRVFLSLTEHHRRPRWPHPSGSASPRSSLARPAEPPEAGSVYGEVLSSLVESCQCTDIQTLQDICSLFAGEVLRSLR